MRSSILGDPFEACRRRRHPTQAPSSPTTTAHAHGIRRPDLPSAATRLPVPRGVRHNDTARTVDPTAPTLPRLTATCCAPTTTYRSAARRPATRSRQPAGWRRGWRRVPQARGHRRVGGRQRRKPSTRDATVRVVRNAIRRTSTATPTARRSMTGAAPSCWRIGPQPGAAGGCG